MDIRVIVQAADNVDELLLARFGPQSECTAVDPGLLAGSAFVANVDLAGGVFPYKHRGQARFWPPCLDELPDFFGHFLADLAGNTFPIQKICSHGCTCPNVLRMIGIVAFDVDRYSCANHHVCGNSTAVRNDYCGLNRGIQTTAANPDHFV